ncbi:MAG: histidine kinase [Bacteroidota bacterium]|nr:histidine kinase [Bacteroidota bacterium]
MKLYELIFSNDKSIRFKRHLFFWLTWCIYLIITYLIPTHWIPGWNIREPTPHIDAYGISLASLRIITAAILLTVVHMALVYGIIYYFLPLYISKQNKWIQTTILLIVFICFISFINYFNFVLAFYLDTRVGFFNSMPDINFILPRWGRQILFNYPTIVGFALAIKLLKKWHLKQQETAEVAREKISAELQLLKAQVHPHFLFNTLNNIYSFIINDSPAAPAVLKKLSTLLHYFIYDCSQSFVKLEKELKMVKDYIDLEKIRYGKNFSMNFQITGSADNQLIAPLFLIPFLENSFKHGASQMLTHPWININITIHDEELFLKLYNSQPLPAGEQVITKGLGLKNVKKRLAILYPENHSLKITNDIMSFNVELKIPLFHSDVRPNKLITEQQVYELV